MADRAELRDRLASATRFRVLEHLDECPSTQDLAASSPEAAVVWADRQTKGRGRRDRSWDSGGALDVEVSFAIPTGGLPEPSLVPVVVPAAVLSALEEVSGLRLGLKWPNDVLASGSDGVTRKLCGMLIDAQGARADKLVVGVGVNVGRTEFGDALRATSFAALGRGGIDRSEVVYELACALDRAVADLQAAELTVWNELFVDRLGLVGRRCRLDLIGGGSITIGVAALDARTCWLADGTALALGEIERAVVV